ncbi:MAG: SDR family NAD(P)-dependent oxidoreductase [Actinomycetota bacterium]
MNWNQKTCLITGASSGFGLRTARLVASKGATVVAVARSESKLRSLIEELGGPPHSYIVCDVSRLEDVRAMARRAGEQVKYLDLLINNAGIATSGPMTEATSEEMAAVIRTNLLGPIWCLRELLPLLEKAPRTNRTPAVVNVASIAGRIAAPGMPDYTASKFGLVGFTEASWAELKAKGVRIMMVNPGPAQTPGFPMRDVLANGLASWTVMDDRRVSAAIVRGIEAGSFEVRVQWWMHLLYHVAIALGPIRKHLADRSRRLAGRP